MKKEKLEKGKKGGGGASWQLSGVLKKEQKLFSSTLRFSDFQIFPGLACSSSLGRGACFAGTIRFSIPVYRPACWGVVWKILIFCVRPVPPRSSSSYF